MPELEEIRRPVADQLQHYEQLLREALSSEAQLTTQMLDHVLASRGKSVRPLMVLLSAAMHGGAESGYVAAMLVEMLHTATLVHDDVIDQSPRRRGKPSVNALWDSRRAVLLGDIILARSFSLGMESGRFDVVAYITACMAPLCEGELLQSDMIASPMMTRAIYEQIIYNKTATLIGTCCGVGALAAGAGVEQAALLKKAGDAAGMAFQIKDDILDFACGDTGKPHLADLREGKITLPLLAVIESVKLGEGEECAAGRRDAAGNLASAPVEAEELVARSGGLPADAVKSGGSSLRMQPSNPASAETLSSITCEQIFELLRAGEVERLSEIVVKGGGVAMASAIMDDYIDSAITTLHAACPPSEYRTSLERLFRFIADREM